MVSTQTATAGFTVWLSGASGTEASSLASLLATELTGRGLSTDVLDGPTAAADPSLGHALGAEDPEDSVRRVGWGCALLNRNGIVAIASGLTPTPDAIRELRAHIGRFVEVALQATSDAAGERDATGPAPDLAIRTDEVERPEATVARIVGHLEGLGWVSRGDADASGAYTADEESEVTDRLRDLGYL